MKPFITIPDHWSPQQADLILDFIDDISTAIWLRYDRQLSLLYSQPAAPDDICEARQPNDENDLD